MEENTSQSTNGAPSPIMLEGEPFFPLKKVCTYTATPRTESQEYIKVNAKRFLPRLTELKGFMEVKGRDNPIVIVGGGPSLKRPEILEELKEMAKKYPVLCAGSSYDWLISQGIIPNAAAVVDPDPIVLNYFKNPQSKTVFLLASQCHPTLFDHLRNYKVALWHSYSKEDDPILNDVEPSFFAIGGGCTIGMRCLSIAMLLGYSNMHLFGYDSCLDDDSSDHAYPLSSDREMKGLMGENGKIYPLKLGFGTPETRTYRCMGYQLAQIWHFHDYYSLHYNMFTPTIHGEGPLKDVAEVVKRKIATGLETGMYEKVDVSNLDHPIDIASMREISPEQVID